MANNILVAELLIGIFAAIPSSERIVANPDRTNFRGNVRIVDDPTGMPNLAESELVDGSHLN